MSGHGHVTPNADGSRARCGGPAICPECAVELARAALQGGAGAGVVKLEPGQTPATVYLAKMIAEREGVAGCARCGGTHQYLDWKAFDRPVPSDSGQYTAWARCPTTGDPIMFDVQEAVE